MINRSYGCVAEPEDPVPVMQDTLLHSGADPVPPVTYPCPIVGILPGSAAPAGCTRRLTIIRSSAVPIMILPVSMRVSPFVSFMGR